MEKIKRALQKEDGRTLREISKELIYRAVETYDKELANTAVVAYALSKLVSKIHIVKNPEWPKFKAILLDSIDKGDPLERVSGIIATIDEDMGNYVHTILEKARVKMASDAYAAGLSMRAAAELTGADINELINYIGKTTIHDEEDVKVGIRERVEALRRLMG